jgi:hypothetical protein
LNPGVFAQARQSPLLTLNAGPLVNDFQFFDWLLIDDLIAVQPEQFTQRRRITFVRFSFVGFFGLDQQDSLAAKVLEHFDQPVVEATDFQNRPEATALFGTLGGQLSEKLDSFFRSRADLSPQDHVTVCVSQVDG